MNAKTWEFEALTDIWTGDIDGRPDRLITTGILGSVRWWFEVVVRGLGGSACDPSAKRKTCQDDKHCVVCELFGCTGWARKFRFDVLDESGRPPTNQITSRNSFRLGFTPLRPIHDEEWTLLDLTLRLIAGYGALGGKTVYKPTDEHHRRSEQHHKDFGLISLVSSPQGMTGASKGELEKYVRSTRWTMAKHNGFMWTSLRSFWCVEGRYLARQDAEHSTFNSVVGRDERKLCKSYRKVHEKAKRCPSTGRFPRRYSADDPSTDPEKWLAGRQGESKKVFSFENPPRTFGFVNPRTINHDDMKARLKIVWADMKPDEYRTGDAILEELLKAREASS